MSMHTSPLDYIKIAAPCSTDWERMTGTNQVRFCDQCSLHVYNLSGMKKRDAESLIASTEGRLCVRFYRRADGTILTNNCPVGLRALKRRLARISTAIASAAFSFLAGVGSFATFNQRSTSVAPFQQQSDMGAMVAVELTPPSPPPPQEVEDIEMKLGKMEPITGEMIYMPPTTPVKQRPKARTRW